MNSRKAHIYTDKQYIHIRINKLHNRMQNYKNKTECIPDEYFHFDINFYLMQKQEEYPSSIYPHVNYTPHEQYPENVIEIFLR